MSDTSNPFENVRTPLFSVGMLLVILGTVMLLYVAVMAFVAISAPEKIQLVQFILDNVKLRDNAISGSMVDPEGRSVEFSIEMSESVRSISFFFMGVALFGVLGGIMKILITTGLKMISMSKKSN